MYSLFFIIDRLLVSLKPSTYRFALWSLWMLFVYFAGSVMRVSSMIHG